MSRFNILTIVAVPLGTLALGFGNPGLFGAILAGWLIITGLGVAIPKLRLFGPYQCRGTGSEKRVALTFDDGPDSRSTPALLDLLREAGVKAAFFGIGKHVAAAGDLAARIVREGHLLENHSHVHSNLTNFFTVGRLRKELTESQNAIQTATGVLPRCFRPPMGLSNPRVFRAARELGLTVVGWTARGFDTRSTHAERIVARIVRRLKPGVIILLHDGGIPAERLVATVKILLDALHTRGYEVVRLDQILNDAC